MNKKFKFFILLFVLLIFALSCSYATNAADDAGSDSAVTASNVEVNKVITKKDTTASSVKTAEKTSQVNTYASLSTELNDNEAKKTINLKNATYKITNPVQINTKSFTKNLVINGNGATIDGSNSKSFLTIYSNNKVTINNLVIKNTKGTSQAGGIVVSDKVTLTLNNCTFINDVSTGKGGAITNRGTTTINDCTFTSNTGAQGGAIWSTGEHGGSLHIENSKFIKNKASNTNNYDKTAVIYVLSGGKVNIISNTFENNNGRSIHSFKANTLISSNIFKNTALSAPKDTIRGGVLDNYEANTIIIGNTFTNINISAQSVKGGLLYNEIGNSLFEDNKITSFKVTATAKSDSLNGGILFNRNSLMNVTDNVFSNTNNGYKVHGGVLYNNIGTLNVYRNTVNTKNTASNEISGGAIYNDKTGSTKSKLYYSGNNFNNLKNTGKVNSKTIYNIGIMQTKSVSIVKKATIITVNPINGAVGDSVTFVANVKDVYSRAVTGGTIVFKINGKSLRTDGTLAGSAGIKYVNVSNGVAKFTTKAQKNLLGTNNITAAYSGNNKFLASTTKVKSISKITLRNAALTVTASPYKQDPYGIIKFTVKIKDVTYDKTTIPANNKDSYVFFRINGAAIKDANGNLIKTKVNKGVAMYNYVVPAGKNSIGTDIKLIKYNLTAEYVNPDYNTKTKNVTGFNIGRSNVTITTSSVVLNKSSRIIQITGNIKDIKNKNVIGKTQLDIKVNGKAVSIYGNSYVNVTNGKISIKFKIPTGIENVTSITLNANANYAYRNTKTVVTSIKRV